MTYYDFRNDVLRDPQLSTDYWVVHCHASAADCAQASNWSDENSANAELVRHAC